MTKVLAPKYNPKEVEDARYTCWEERRYFHSEPDGSKKSFAIVIPPPNITGVLHMGHALNTIIQDVLIRWKRMQGENTLWMPGTDHAGIATQNVVERSLLQRGLKRQEMGREKFLDAVWEWRNKYGSTIINQLKKLASSCDWERERFTLDDGLARAVRECFVHLWERGLIYRGKYIVNWCPRCNTAISDEEVEHKEADGHLWYIKYPLEGSDEHLMVGTTRPETMLGDTAVAVHPDDERYRHLKGKKAILPFLDRPLDIVFDDWVDPEFGTGAVKVTPAHDPNDYEIGKRHNLPRINILNPDNTLNTNVPQSYRGLRVAEARKKVVQDIKK
ncbi:MAG: class I tRNA ligase family protein, partial [Anaerolineales bacterium]|nr:class I tRNA ligase family protein [Anaerolineales bacterium]